MKTKRLGTLQDFPEILERTFRGREDEWDEIMNDGNIPEVEKYVFGHHVDYDSLLRSKQQGCAACRQFDHDYDEDDEKSPFAEMGYYSVFCVEMSAPENNRQPMMIVYLEEPLLQFCHDMTPHDDSDDLNSVISPLSSSTETWALIELWLERCLADHEVCGEELPETFLPSRLLELNTVGTEKFFRLVFRDDINPKERYLTLSHCWGPAPAEKKLRLLDETEASLRDGMPVSILPKTFRDAFQVVERLGVRYLWIDRLCIVQDSPEDWRAEAGMMQIVYRHGFLNIAALGAADDEGGCFFEREPQLVAPTVINLSPPDIPDGDPTFYRLTAENDAWRNTFDGEPLLTRAWVLQERVLATRNLYFGSKQVFWECAEVGCCETNPAGRVIENRRSPNHYSVIKSRTKSWKALLDPSHTGSSRSMTNWTDVVQTYCQCNLTFSGDKLVALSGLAKHMSDMLSEELGPRGVEYLAGLWKNTMPGSLLWKPAVSHVRRSSSYRAPSWSWASLDGEIVFTSAFRADSRCRVEVVRAETLAKDNDSTGEILGGAIALEGPTLTARGLKRIKMIDGDHNVCSPAAIYRPRDGAMIKLANKFTLYVHFDTTEDYHSEVTVLIFSTMVGRQFPNLEMTGLALVPTEASTATYHRVGYVWFQSKVDLSEEDHERDRASKWTLDSIKLIYEDYERDLFTNFTLSIVEII